ncbi:MAG: TolC family protein, partial [Terasakiella sp.]|nr:TolC family protein [Terasakiella sp.]
MIIAVASAPGLMAAAPAPRLLSPELPAEWRYTEAAEQTLPTDDAWWRGFGDPVLDSLIAMGEQANYDLAGAMHRMEAARRQIQVSRAAYFPQIGISGGYSRSRADGLSLNTYTASATASWELDIFGRVGAAVKRDKAQYRASRAEWTGTQVSVAAEIASTYIQLRVYQAEVAVAEAHVARQDTIAGLAQTRFDCGLASKIDVDQARGILYSTRASLPALRASVRSAINALGLLTARYATELEPMLAAGAELPDYRRLVATG